MVEKVERIVLTGGPSSGKTTIIRLLESKGHNVLKESAREILEKFGQPKNQKEAFNLEIFMYEVQKEREDSCFGRTFLDRSQIDNIAYAKHFLGYHPKEMPLPKDRYHAVFVLERLPFVSDGTRTEKSDEEASHRHNLVLNEYLARGYSPIIVSVFPSDNFHDSVKRRVDFIMSHIK